MSVSTGPGPAAGVISHPASREMPRLVLRDKGHPVPDRQGWAVLGRWQTNGLREEVNVLLTC